MWQIPRIETNRLILRGLGPKDLNDTLEHRCNKEVCKYISDPMTAEEVIQFLKKNTANWNGEDHETIFLGIEYKKNKKLIGELMFKYWSKKNKQGEIGFRLNPVYQKMGLATEAALNWINFLFQRMELHKIMAICDSENIRSYYLMERIGMTRESHYKEHIFLDNKWRDQYQYALLRSNWDPIRKMPMPSKKSTMGTIKS